VESKNGAGTTAGAPVKDTESPRVGHGGAALDTLGKAKATPTIAVVRISFSFIVAPLGASPWRFVVYHSNWAGSRERTFSSDIAYSDSPAPFAYGPWLTNAMHCPWFLKPNCAQPPLWHWSLPVRTRI
jgi:hypothetical protein